MVRPQFVVSLLLVLTLCLAAAAQRSRSPAEEASELEVHVLSPGGRPVSRDVDVELLNSGGIAVDAVPTDDLGRARFRAVLHGNYRVRLSSAVFREQTSAEFHVDAGEHPHVEFVRAEANDASHVPPTATVSQTQLRIPAKAVEEVRRGNEVFNRKDWRAAIEHYEKATAISPQYALAHRNLGSAYSNNGETEKARAAFETAIRLDDHLFGAYLNLARLLQLQNRDANAELLLERAVSLEPLNPEAWTLLAWVQLRQGKLEGAVASARRVHVISPERFPVAHCIAAMALAARKDYAGAAAEYELFLRESPDDPGAPQARAALAQLRQESR